MPASHSTFPLEYELKTIQMIYLFVMASPILYAVMLLMASTPGDLRQSDDPKNAEVPAAIMQERQGSVFPILSMIGLVLVGVNGAASWPIRNMTLRLCLKAEVKGTTGTVTSSEAGNKPDKVRPTSPIYTATLIFVALCGGPVLPCMMGYMIEGFSYALVGVVVMTAWMILKFPTRDRYQSWAQEVDLMRRDRGSRH